MGQMPSFLREGMIKTGDEYKDANLGVGSGLERGVKTIIIAKGNYRWFAQSLHARFILYPQNKFYVPELILMHESAHLSIQGKNMVRGGEFSKCHHCTIIIKNWEFRRRKSLTDFG